MLPSSIKDTINECVTNSCENGGTCYGVELVSGSITCECALGYEGDSCQIKGELKLAFLTFDLF